MNVALTDGRTDGQTSIKVHVTAGNPDKAITNTDVVRENSSSYTSPFLSCISYEICFVYVIVSYFFQGTGNENVLVNRLTLFKAQMNTSFVTK
jgi:hypothetical protein